LVKQAGFEYVWIDTCCIDKERSAELSEAINSMYRWYKEAQVCIAYLADVPSEDSPRSLYSALAMSRWFTRGWTLQELIAPPTVKFYGRDWREIGTKWSLQKIISEVTGIPVEVLTTGDLRDISVAQRMSWASRRETTRHEDLAYCLMGLFDVNMPILYGEGERAFTRLQEEIINISNDHSLFAWQALKDSLSDRIYRGLLADFPSDFVHSSQITPSRPNSSSALYQMTKLGSCIELPLISFDGEYRAILNCQKGSGDDHLLGIELTPISGGDERYARSDASTIIKVRREDAIAAPQKLCILHEIGKGTCSISWVITPLEGHGYKVSDVHPPCTQDGMIRVNAPSNSILGALMFENKSAEKFAVVIGLAGGEPWCDIVTEFGNQELKMICQTFSYRGHYGRAGCDLSAKMSASVAIEKGERKLKALEDNYDEGYTLYIKLLQHNPAEELDTA
jgi:hypothetical protein